MKNFEELTAEEIATGIGNGDNRSNLFFLLETSRPQFMKILKRTNPTFFKAREEAFKGMSNSDVANLIAMHQKAGNVTLYKLKDEPFLADEEQTELGRKIYECVSRFTEFNPVN